MQTPGLDGDALKIGKRVGVAAGSRQFLAVRRPVRILECRDEDAALRKHAPALAEEWRKLAQIDKDVCRQDSIRASVSLRLHDRLEIALDQLRIDPAQRSLDEKQQQRADLRVLVRPDRVRASEFTSAWRSSAPRTSAYKPQAATCFGEVYRSSRNSVSAPA